MKDHNLSDEPQDDSNNLENSKYSSSNTVGLRFALPVLGGLLLLVALTAGALFYQRGTPQTTRSSALESCGSGNCVTVDPGHTVFICTCPNQTRSGVTCDESTGGRCSAQKNNTVHPKRYCANNTCGTVQIDYAEGDCFASNIESQPCGGGGGGDSTTPTRTPTRGTATRTPTRTPTRGTATRTPTRGTATRTPTRGTATRTPTRGACPLIPTCVPGCKVRGGSIPLSCYDNPNECKPGCVVPKR